MRLEEEEEEFLEQQSGASSVRGTRCGECQSRLAHDFSISQLSPMFSLRAYPKTPARLNVM